MKMTRRQFLKTIAAAAAAPAIVKAENLMKIQVPPEKKIVTSVDIFESEFEIIKPWQINPALEPFEQGGKPEMVAANRFDVEEWSEAVSETFKDAMIYGNGNLRIKRKPLGPARTPEEAEEMLKRVMVRFPGVTNG